MVKITKSLSFMASAACLSTMLFMSSCSKDDATMPSPEVTVTNDGSNLKTNLIGSGYGITPFGIPATIGQPGLGSFPAGYTIYAPSPSSSKNAGLSTFQYLFGNSSTPWIPAINAAPTGAGTFLTLGATKNKSTFVKVDITKLARYKRYKFTYYVSTLAAKYSSSPGKTPYAFAIDTYLDNSEASFGHFHDLTGKENQWIAKSLEFRSNTYFDPSDYSKAELTITLHGTSSAVAYGNIFIPEGSVQEIE